MSALPSDAGDQSQLLQSEQEIVPELSQTSLPGTQSYRVCARTLLKPVRSIRETDAAEAVSRTFGDGWLLSC